MEEQKRKFKNILELFTDNQPKVIAIVADPHQGKTNVMYHAIDELLHNPTIKSVRNIAAFGLSATLPEEVQTIGSVRELETIHDSIVFVDEFQTLFELYNRKKFEIIEKFLRRRFWSNNIIVLCGLGSNFNKYTSGHLTYIVYKRATLCDMINRSRVQQVAESCKIEAVRGSEILDIPQDEALIWSAIDYGYSMVSVPYLKQYDMKRFNRPIIEFNTPDKVKTK